MIHPAHLHRYLRQDLPTDPVERQLLEIAVGLALIWHDGQRDKNGVDPYVLHPIAVSGLVAAAGGDLDQQIAALLHDVVEDTPVTLEVLATAGVPVRALAIVEALTHLEGDSYNDYLIQVANHRPALLVKRCDIAHNTDPARLARLEPATADRLRRKYADALEFLDGAETWLYHGGRERAHALAQEALDMAREGDVAGAATRLITIHDGGGVGGINYAMHLWCDTVAAYLEEHGAPPESVVGLKFHREEATGPDRLLDADDVAPAQRWAGRYIVARIQMDQATAAALRAVLPDDPLEVGDHVMAVLMGCATWLDRVAGDDPPVTSAAPALMSDPDGPAVDRVAESSRMRATLRELTGLTGPALAAATAETAVVLVMAGRGRLWGIGPGKYVIGPAGTGGGLPTGHVLGVLDLWVRRCVEHGWVELPTVEAGPPRVPVTLTGTGRYLLETLAAGGTA